MIQNNNNTQLKGRLNRVLTDIVLFQSSLFRQCDYTRRDHRIQKFIGSNKFGLVICSAAT